MTLTTPLAEVTAPQGLCSYEGAQMAASFRDPDGELHALLKAGGIFDLGFRAKIEVRGRDRQRWLNGMISNNVRDLPTGRGVYAFLLNAQGHILGDMYVYNRGENFLLDTSRAQAPHLLGLLKRYIIMDKVELVEVSTALTGLAIAGPEAGQILAAMGIEPGPLAPLQFADLAWRDLPLTLMRGDEVWGELFEIWLSPENAPSLWKTLHSAGAQPAGAKALEMFRILRGIPRYGQDIRERDLPEETGQLRALSFTKGCYIGQEIVERIRSRGAVHRQFTGFVLEDGPAVPGTKIQSEGKEAGELTSVAEIGAGNAIRKVALGYLRREAAGGELTAEGTRLRVCSLPFRIEELG